MFIAILNICYGFLTIFMLFIIKRTTDNIFILNLIEMIFYSYIANSIVFYSMIFDRRMKIIEFVKHLSKINNKNFYLDCWAGYEKLKQFYKKCDLKYLGDYPEDDYYVSIFEADPKA